MKNILMAVYNSIENDGRVKRSAETLSKYYNVNLVCIKSGLNFIDTRYNIIKVPLNNIHPIIKILYFWASLLKLSKKNKPDLIYVHDFFLVFPGYLISKIFSIPIIYDSHELIIPTKGLSMTIRERVYFLLEKLVINKLDLVICANEERSDLMMKYYRLKILPISVKNISIPTYNILNKKNTLIKYPKLRKNNIDDKHIIYMGDISFLRGIDVLIDAVLNLPQNFKLILVGVGPDFNEILNKYKIFPDKIRLIGSVTHDEVQDVVSTADIGVVVYSNKGLNNVYCSPNKIYEYTQAGLVVLTTSQPSLLNIINKYKIGAVFGCNDNTSLSEISDIISDISNNITYYQKNIPIFLDSNNYMIEQKKIEDSVYKILNT